MGAWLSAFLVTQAIEVPIYRRALRSRPLGLALALAFAASLITHPLVWLGVPRLGLPYVPAVAVAEAFAIAVEALWLLAWRAPHPLAWSVLANAASAGIGLTLRALVGWP